MRTVTEFEQKVKEFYSKLSSYASRAEMNSKTKEIWANFDKC